MPMLLVICKKKKSKILANIVKFEEENLSHLLNNLVNFNEIFWKNVTYENLKNSASPYLSRKCI